MDINAADIAALEKILHWAEELSLQDGGSRPDNSAPPPEGEPPPHEDHGAPLGDEPALEIEVEAAPAPEKTELGSYRFGGGPPRRPSPPEQDPERRPGRGGKRGRY